MRSNGRNRTGSNGRHRRPRSLAEPAAPGLAAELLDFILHSKKWWLTPTVVVLLLLSLMTAVSGSGAAPFVYSLY